MSLLLFFLPLVSGDVPSLAALDKLPCIRDVKLVRVGQPRHRIIHILDWHYVEKELFTLDLEQVRKVKLSTEQAEKEFAAFLEGLETFQAEQMQVLRFLRARAVFSEGLSEKNLAEYRQTVSLSRKLIEDLEERLKREKDKESRALFRVLLDDEREGLLRLGSPARLLLKNEIRVLPLEDAALFAAAKPIKDGRIVFDAQKIQARRDAMVHRCLTRKTAFIVLGASHDLTENLRRIAKTDFEYVRVKVKSLE